jgi:hypothetical protein
MPLDPMDWAQYYAPVDSGLFEDCVTVSVYICKSYGSTMQNIVLDSFRCRREI